VIDDSFMPPNVGLSPVIVAFSNTNNYTKRYYHTISQSILAIPVENVIVGNKKYFNIKTEVPASGPSVSVFMNYTYFLGTLA
jgi:hypothetical protein